MTSVVSWESLKRSHQSVREMLGVEWVALAEDHCEGIASLSGSCAGGDQALQPASPRSEAQASGKRPDLPGLCHVGEWVMNVFCCEVKGDQLILPLPSESML